MWRQSFIITECIFDAGCKSCQANRNSYDGTVFFLLFLPTVNNNSATMKLFKECVGFLCSRNNLRMGFCFAPADIVQISIWCLNVIVWVYFDQQNIQQSEFNKRRVIFSLTISDDHCVLKSMRHASLPFTLKVSALRFMTSLSWLVEPSGYLLWTLKSITCWITVGSILQRHCLSTSLTVSGVCYFSCSSVLWKCKDKLGDVTYIFSSCEIASVPPVV